MGDLKLTTTIDGDNPTLHDLELSLGQIQWTGIDQYDAEDQAEIIAQRVRCRLQYLKGEWYLDQRAGVPWMQAMAAKGTTRARMARIIRAALASTPGVSRVKSVTVAATTIDRSATITFAVEGDARRVIGPITLDVPFIVAET